MCPHGEEELTMTYPLASFMLNLSGSRSSESQSQLESDRLLYSKSISKHCVGSYGEKLDGSNDKIKRTQKMNHESL